MSRIQATCNRSAEHFVTARTPRFERVGCDFYIGLGRHYFNVILLVSGNACDDPPTMNEYSPGRSFHPSAASSKIDRYLGSIVTLTSLLSPGFSFTRLHPTSRFGGSPAAAGSPA